MSLKVTKMVKECEISNKTFFVLFLYCTICTIWKCIKYLIYEMKLDTCQLVHLYHEQPFHDAV